MGVRLPQRLPVSACYTLGQVELCRGGATCVPALESMLCVSRGLAYERHTYVVLEGTYMGEVHDCSQASGTAESSPCPTSAPFCYSMRALQAYAT